MADQRFKTKKEKILFNQGFNTSLSLCKQLVKTIADQYDTEDPDDLLSRFTALQVLENIETFIKPK